MLVRDVMTSPVVSVQPAVPARAAAALLTERGFTALPVVDGDGDLVGILTEADLLRGRIRHDDHRTQTDDRARPRKPLTSNNTTA